MLLTADGCMQLVVVYGDLEMAMLEGFDGSLSSGTNVHFLLPLKRSVEEVLRVPAVFFLPR